MTKARKLRCVFPLSSVTENNDWSHSYCDTWDALNEVFDQLKEDRSRVQVTTCLKFSVKTLDNSWPRNK